MFPSSTIIERARCKTYADLRCSSVLFLTQVSKSDFVTITSSIFFIVNKVCSTHDAAATPTPRKVCYDVIGCFERFETNPHMPLPLSPEEVDANFLLHTNPLPETEENINATELSIKSSSFDATKKTKLVIHGFAVLWNDVHMASARFSNSEMVSL